MKVGVGVLALAMLCAACGLDTASQVAPTSSTELDRQRPAGSVEVVITATPVAGSDGSVELCPPGMTGKCPGIQLDGELPSGLLSDESTTKLVQVTGWYDGAAIVPTSDPVEVEYPPADQPDFSSLCPDMRGTASVNPDDAVTEALADYVADRADYAAMWWDPESAVMTVWFVGDDVSDQAGAIAELVADEPVCVAGGAAFSESELMEAADLLNGVRDSRGLPLATFGYAVGGRSNRIEVPVEGLDTQTRRAIADLVGDRVALYPFLEILGSSLADLPEPVPVVPGDVELLTSRVRSGGGMLALGQFRVEHDPDLNCVYFPGNDSGDGGRTVPVWPFGYSATASPLTIYDYDGEMIAGEGDTIELGGGFVDLDFLDQMAGANACGATGAWIVNV